MKKIYTGIGHRDSPKEILELCQKIGYQLALKGFTLRSGGALGCDTAFEQGCYKAKGTKEIYLPYKNFGKKWNRKKTTSDIDQPTKETKDVLLDLIDEYKDFNTNCEDWVWNLTLRNMHQVLGLDLKTPSAFVFCYTKNGKEIGGTRWAIRLAKKNNIPIYNLGNKLILKQVLEAFNKNEKN